MSAFFPDKKTYLISISIFRCLFELLPTPMWEQGSLKRKAINKKALHLQLHWLVVLSKFMTALARSKPLFSCLRLRKKVTNKCGAYLHCWSADSFLGVFWIIIARRSRNQSINHDHLYSTLFIIIITFPKTIPAAMSNAFMFLKQSQQVVIPVTLPRIGTFEFSRASPTWLGHVNNNRWRKQTKQILILCAAKGQV